MKHVDVVHTNTRDYKNADQIDVPTVPQEQAKELRTRSSTQVRVLLHETMMVRVDQSQYGKYVKPRTVYKE